MPETFSFTITSEHSGRRLDVFVANNLQDISRTRVQKLIASGKIHLNGQPAYSRSVLSVGDVITGEVKELETWNVNPQDIPLDIVYEDEYLAVINKPRGLAVHPGAGRPSGTLVNALAARYGSLPDGSAPERPGIVHRLDMDTSGLMVVALSKQTMAKLSEMVAERKIERSYHALVWGEPRFEKAVVDASIGRDPKHPERMSVLPENGAVRSRAAITDLRVLERFEGAALLEAKLHTGRTHQIRVHSAYAGCPIVGDHVYGLKKPAPFPPFTASERIEYEGLRQKLCGQALHSRTITFRHPMTEANLSFTEEIPPVMADVVEFFRKRSIKNDQ